MTSRAPLVTAVLVLALLAASASRAHIGSPDVFYEGDAGPYPVRVIVSAPPVVPGLAEITVRVKEGQAERVAVRPVLWRAGIEGSPSPDLAQPVRGEAGLWTAQLWLMSSSSYSVHVEVEGPAGSGTAMVPVMAVATRRLGMAPGLGWLLAGLGLLLFVGAVTAVGAAVRESVLAPGETPSPRRRKAARSAMAVSTVVLALGVYGGKSWWDAEDAGFTQSMQRSFEIATEARVEPSGHRTLKLSIENEDWRSRRWTPIVPDHGKLMHMFLVAEPGLDGFAHIHPLRRDEDTFEVDVSAMPAGDYRVYADVTHGSGWTQTLTDLVSIGAGGDAGVERADELAPDPDDSWHVAGPQSPAEYRFDDGTAIVWQRPEALVTGRDLDLSFALRGADGGAAAVEPYMGMFGHAAIRRHDGEVFIHLHPTGTISMAAQRLFEEESFRSREFTDDGEGLPDPSLGSEAQLEPDHAGHSMKEMVVASGEVSMPYAFPRPGTYRLWVQMKSGGRVYTGVFDAEVVEQAG